MGIDQRWQLGEKKLRMTILDKKFHPIYRVTGYIMWYISSILIVNQREAQRIWFNTQKCRFLGSQEKGHDNLIEVLYTYVYLI